MNNALKQVSECDYPTMAVRRGSVDRLRARADSLAAERDAAIKERNGWRDAAKETLECTAYVSLRADQIAKDKDSLTASITAACAGTGCVNAHELAEALKAARQLIDDHCADEEKVRAILAEFDKSDTHGSDGPIELAERAAEALKQARADRDVLAYEVRKWRTTDKENGDWLAIGMGCCMDTDVSGALSRVNGGGE